MSVLPPKQPYPRDAVSVEGLPDPDNEIMVYTVGTPPWSGGKRHSRAVTRITVDADLPGLHCYLERVRVWIGDTMIAEFPMHNTGFVQYPLPADGEASA